MKTLTTHFLLAWAVAASAPGALVSYTFDAGPQALPDGSATGVAQSVAVQSALTSITSARVGLSLTGGWLGDVHAFLQRGGTTGEAAVLINRIGDGASSAVALDATFADSAASDIHGVTGTGAYSVAGTYQPDGRVASPLLVTSGSSRDAMLAVFNGKSADATWTLHVADVAVTDINSLHRWTLELTGPQGTGDTVITPWNNGATTQSTVIFANPANDWSTGTVISGGATLRSEADEVIPNGSVLTLGNGSNTAGTLQLQGHAETVAGLASAGTGGKSIELGGGTLIVSQAGDSTYDGTLSGAGAFTKSGAGKLSLAGDAAHTGATTVSGGTLALAPTGALSQTSSVDVSGGTLLLEGQPGGGRIADGAAVELSGGKIAFAGNTGSVTEGVGVLTLVGGGNVIDFGAASPGVVLRFADSSGVPWTGGTLSVWNWTAGVTQLFFGTDAGGLTGEQVDAITFYSDGGTTLVGTGTMFASGQLAPVPEPGALGALVALLGAVGWRERRRRG